MLSFSEISSNSIDITYKVNGQFNSRIIKALGVDNLWPNFDGDDFSGMAVAGPWDTRIWHPVYPTTGEATIQSGPVGRIIIPNGEENNHWKHQRGIIVGDFDIQVDFSGMTGLVDAVEFLSLHITNLLNSNGVSDTMWCGCAMYYPGASQYYRFRYNNGSNNSWDDVATTDTSGKFRLTRTGSNVSAYYYDSGWTQIGSAESWGADDIYCGVLSYRPGTTKNADLVIDYGNYTINSGVVVPPNWWDLFRGDDFTGVDDDPPDPRTWKFVTGYTGDAYTTIQGNVLDFDPPNDNANYIARLQSRFNLAGDFDIQLDFHHNTFSVPSSGADISYLPYLIIRTVDGDTAIAYIQRRRFISGAGDDDYNAYGTDQAEIDAEDSESTGKLRITRIAGNIKVYYWSSSQWEFDGDTGGLSVVTSDDSDVYVEIWLEQAANSITDGYIDNFVINKGWVFSSHQWDAFGGDDFRGDDGDPPKPNLWEDVNGSNVTIQNNKYDFVPDDTSETFQTYRLRGLLTGDFDIQIDWADVSIGQPAAAQSYCPYFHVKNPALLTVALITRYRDSTTEGLWSDGNRGGVGAYKYANTDTSGSFRITRIGTNIYVYAWIGGRWEWDGNASGRLVGDSTDPLIVGIYHLQYANTTVVGNCDNFWINSGKLIAR